MGLGLKVRQRQPNCVFKDPRITCVLAEKGRCPWAVESETSQPSLDSCHTTGILSLVGLQESLLPCRWGSGYTLADLEESWLSYHWEVCSRYSTARRKAAVAVAVAAAERRRPYQDLDLTLA